MASTERPDSQSEKPSYSSAYLGGGCFWCTEALYENLEGVISVEPGYAGGKTVNPTYKEISSGDTGHAEIIHVEYDPSIITYENLLNFFWEAHDPTTLNQQGADTGTQYRSIILYQNEAEKVAAFQSKKEAQANFEKPIVTEIVPLEKFYVAENYHHDYYANNQNAPYCRFVIAPKLKKLKEKNIPLFK